MLEPTKEPVKPVSAAEMIASIGQVPPVAPEKSSCPSDSAQVGFQDPTSLSRLTRSIITTVTMQLSFLLFLFFFFSFYSFTLLLFVSILFFSSFFHLILLP